MSAIILMCCQNSPSSGVPSSEVQDNGESNQLKTLPFPENTIDEVLIPESIKECMSKVNSREPIEIEYNFNPYYQRGNLDGNGIIDLAVLVRSTQHKQVRGLLICKDSEMPFLFGRVSKSDIPCSDMADDNFITDNWEILKKKEISDVVNDQNGLKIGKDAKGEGIGFFFEGGGIYVYWNGKEFKCVGGV